MFVVRFLAVAEAKVELGVGSGIDDLAQVDIVVFVCREVNLLRAAQLVPEFGEPDLKPLLHLLELGNLVVDQANDLFLQVLHIDLALGLIEHSLPARHFCLNLFQRWQDRAFKTHGLQLLLRLFELLVLILEDADLLDNVAGRVSLRVLQLLQLLQHLLLQ